MTRSLVVGIGIWIVVLILGMGATARRDFKAGGSGEAPSDWPRDSSIDRASQSSTLLVFAHPHCPCSRATLNELERIVARCHQHVSVQVVFCVPLGAPEGWERTGLWDQAASIPGVRVSTDPGTREARRFGAFTSGDALLYDSAGGLLFHGGITGSRGHEGDNSGESAIVSLVRDGRADLSACPAFGCSLFDPDLSAEHSP
jgi:hypothetical protein